MTKPADHPDYFRRVLPGGSRESAIVLDRDGRFWHEGEPVQHPATVRALHRWISRHPDDGRLILSNGFEWCYFRAEDAPFVVRGLELGAGGVVELELSDESRERLDPRTLCIGDDEVLYARVKDGRFEARFSRRAQAELAPLVRGAEPPTLEVGGVLYPIDKRPTGAA